MNRQEIILLEVVNRSEKIVSMDLSGLICTWDYTEKSLDTQYSIIPSSKKILEINFDQFFPSKKPVFEKFSPNGTREDYLMNPYSLPIHIKDEIERYTKSFNIDFIKNSSLENFVLKSNVEVEFCRYFIKNLHESLILQMRYIWMNFLFSIILFINIMKKYFHFLQPLFYY